jgi:hypothetical protein
MFRFETKCVPTPSGVGLDCICQNGEIAIAGGGWASGGYLVESAHIYVDENTRSLSGWRVACMDRSGSWLTCGNAYVLCVRVSKQ